MANEQNRFAEELAKVLESVREETRDSIDMLFESFEHPEEPRLDVTDIKETYQSLTNQELTNEELTKGLQDYATKTGEEIQLINREGAVDKEFTVAPLQPEQEQNGVSQDIIAKLQEAVTHDPRVQAASMQALIDKTEEELMLCQNEIDKSIDNLEQLHIQAEEALRTGQPLPGNYEKTTQDLISNIDEQRAKLNELKPQLDDLYKAQGEHSMEMYRYAQKQDVPQTLRERMVTHAKGIFQTMAKGFRDIGNFLHERNELFRAGTITAMKSIGDIAQGKYAKILLNLNRNEERFQGWIKNIGEKMLDIGAQTREKANELRDSLSAGANKAKDAVVRTSQAIGQAIRDEHAIRGDLKYNNVVDLSRKIRGDEESMVRIDARGRNSVLSNMLYNQSRDSAIKNLDKLATLADKELLRLDTREKNGKYINQDTKQKFLQVKAMCQEKYDAIQKAGHREFKPQSLGQDR